MFRALLGALLAFAMTAYASESEEHVHKTVAVGSATRLVADVEYGSFRVYPSSGANVEIDVTFRGNPPSRSELDRVMHDFVLDVDRAGSEIHLNSKFRSGRKPYISDPGSFLSWLFGGSVWLHDIEYNISMPARLEPQLKTSGGSISVEGIHNNVTVRTSGGSIHLSNIEGKAEAWTSGGSIEIDGVSGFVNAHTSGGALRFSDLGGGVDGSTSGGSVAASFRDQPTKDSRLSTSGGGINVHLASNIRVTLDASTSGGGVSTDFPVSHDHEHPDRSELHTDLNGGGPRLSLHTSGGGISIRHSETSADVRGRHGVN